MKDPRRFQVWIDGRNVQGSFPLWMTLHLCEELSEQDKEEIAQLPPWRFFIDDSCTFEVLRVGDKV